MKRKKYSDRTIFGQRGVNFIENIVLEMGFAWNPTNLDAGIDGYIELRNNLTEEATNFIIQVQSKATSTQFPGDTSEKFDFYCTESDLEYWLSGNCPVLLICVSLLEMKAYWVSLKEYFKDPIKLKSKKITFNKRKDMFDINTKEKLSQLAIPEDSGFYFSPPNKKENLYPNILLLKRYPSEIYYADTDYRESAVFWNDLNLLEDKHGINKSWILLDGRIYSFNNLENAPWINLINGKIEKIKTIEWANSIILEKRRNFVMLMNSTFESFAYSKKLIRKKTKKFDLYYFKPQLDQRDDPKTKEGNYNRFGRHSKQNVCNRYFKKLEPDKITYFRHLAFEKSFIRLEEKWYLEINPTYLFTHNGFKVHKYYESKLKGKKSLDKAETIFSQIIFWAQELSKVNRLFGEPLLEFSELMYFDFERGINDKIWLEKEDPDIKKLLASEKGIFE